MIELGRIRGKIREALRPEEAVTERELLALLTPVLKRVKSDKLALPLTIAPQREPQIQGFPQGRQYLRGKFIGYSGGSARTSIDGPVVLRSAQKQARVLGKTPDELHYELATHSEVESRGSFSASSVRRALSGDQGQRGWNDASTWDGIIRFSAAPDGTLTLDGVSERFRSSDWLKDKELISKGGSTRMKVLKQAITYLEAYAGTTESENTGFK